MAANVTLNSTTGMGTVWIRLKLYRFYACVARCYFHPVACTLWGRDNCYLFSELQVSGIFIDKIPTIKLESRRYNEFIYIKHSQQHLNNFVTGPNSLPWETPGVLLCLSLLTIVYDQFTDLDIMCVVLGCILEDNFRAVIPKIILLGVNNMIHVVSGFGKVENTNVG